MHRTFCFVLVIRSQVRSDTHTEAWLLKRDNTAISITPDGGVHATAKALSGAANPLVYRVKMQEAMVISVACERNFCQLSPNCRLG